MICTLCKVEEFEISKGQTLQNFKKKKKKEKKHVFLLWLVLKTDRFWCPISDTKDTLMAKKLGMGKRGQNTVKSLWSTHLWWCPQISPYEFDIKQHLNSGKWNVGYLSACGCGVFVSSVWKNIGMTINHANILSAPYPVGYFWPNKKYF